LKATQKRKELDKEQPGCLFAVCPLHLVLKVACRELALATKAMKRHAAAAPTQW